jgi:hypothetical protein
MRRDRRTNWLRFVIRACPNQLASPSFSFGATYVAARRRRRAPGPPPFSSMNSTGEKVSARDRQTANDQSKVAVKCPTLFNFRHIEQRKPLFAGRISETIVKRHYFQ